MNSQLFKTLLDACVRGTVMQSGRRVVSRAQRPMGRRRERRPHRKRDSETSRKALTCNPSTSGFTGKPALVLDRPGGIPQGYGLTSRRSVTEPRWVSSPPSHCATAPLLKTPLFTAEVLTRKLSFLHSPPACGQPCRYVGAVAGARAPRTPRVVARVCHRASGRATQPVYVPRSPRGQGCRQV